MVNVALLVFCFALGIVLRRSAIWGEVTAFVGLPTAHFLAALGAVVAIPLTWRWKLQTDLGVDLTPSMHWPAPLTAQDIEQDRGPVLVTVDTASVRRIAKRSYWRWKKSAVSDAATAPIGGACTRTLPSKDALSKHSWWHPGLSIYASTSALPTPIVCRRRWFSAST